MPELRLLVDALRNRSAAALLVYQPTRTPQTATFEAFHNSSTAERQHNQIVLLLSLDFCKHRNSSSIGTAITISWFIYFGDKLTCAEVQKQMGATYLQTSVGVDRLVMPDGNDEF
jgi:hypothetical protein